MNDKLMDKKDTNLALGLGAIGKGFEEPVEQENLIIPRAKLVQGLPKEMAEMPEHVKPGMIINSLTKEILPNVFIPIFKFTNFIRFNARKKEEEGFDPAYGPGELIWRSDDPKDPRVMAETKFGPDGEKPIATTFWNFFSYFPGVPMPIIVSFSKSSFKTGKELFSLARFAANQQYPNMFNSQYKLTSAFKENEQGAFYLLKVAGAGRVEDKNDLQLCDVWYDSFKSQAIKMDESNLASEEEQK